MRGRTRTGWPTPKPKAVDDGFLWLGALLLLALCLVVLFYFAATAGCVSGDLVLIKIDRGESEPQTVMEVQADADNSRISEGQEDVSRPDSSRDLGAFLEFWGD